MAQAARTESAFREVNEAIAKTAVRFEADEATFICECADPTCAHRVTAELEDYEEVRADATHFLLAPGHSEPAVERVVEEATDFEVVEKSGPIVSRIVRRLNPRARPV
ncbi:MAG TPA: hypothetical protein VMU73_02600 [Gaiellaceae bacterium]|nr:hypothetical protein [Gaiellaceae bacterium]